MLETFTANFTGKPREAKLEGRDHLVFPGCILRVGVHSGSNGATLYEKKDIETYLPAWNQKPVVINHPVENGVFVSADSPTILSNSKVGVISSNVMKGDGQFCDIWLDKGRLTEVYPSLLEAIAEGIAIELSTGLFSDNEKKEGEWNGKHYDQIARVYRPDHLALLPDKVGACSLADGCGMFTASEAIPLERMLKIRDGLNSLWKGVPVTSNCSCKSKGHVMERKAQIDALVASGDWEESDRPELEKMDEKLFSREVKRNERTIKLNKEIEALKEKKEKEKPAEKTKEEIRNEAINSLIASKNYEEADRKSLAALEDNLFAKVVKAAVPAKEPEKKAATTEEFLESVPQEFRETLTNGLNAHKAQRASIVDAILANKANSFTKEELADEVVYTMQRLQKIAKGFLANSENKADQTSKFDFLGNVGGHVSNGAANIPVLDTPVWEPAKA